MSIFFQILLMGIIATVAMDVWLLILKRVFGLPTTNWAMVGRWFGHLPGGKFVHRPIGDSIEIRNEEAIGWLLHYVIGVVYAALYSGMIVMMAPGNPTILSALLFGIATVLVPWFILQPGLGLGVLARLAPKPKLVRAISLSVHSIFGLSLYFGWLVATFISLKV